MFSFNKFFFTIIISSKILKASLFFLYIQSCVWSTLISFLLSKILLHNCAYFTWSCQSFTSFLLEKFDKFNSIFGNQLFDPCIAHMSSKVCIVCLCVCILTACVLFCSWVNFFQFEKSTTIHEKFETNSSIHVK